MEQRNEELEDSLDEIRGFDDNFETAYREHKFRDEGEDEQDYGLIGFKKVGQNFAAVEVKCSIKDNDDPEPEYKMFKEYMAKLEEEYGDVDDSIELDIDEEVKMSGLDTMVHPLDDSFDAMGILDICDKAPDPIAMILEQRGIIMPQRTGNSTEMSDVAPDPIAVVLEKRDMALPEDAIEVSEGAGTEVVLGIGKQKAKNLPQKLVEIPKKSDMVLKPMSFPVTIKQKVMAHPLGAAEIPKKSNKAQNPYALRRKIKQEDMAYSEDTIDVLEMSDKALEAKVYPKENKKHPQDAIEIPKKSDMAPESKKSPGKVKKKLRKGKQKDMAHSDYAIEIPENSDMAQEPKAHHGDPQTDPEIRTSRLKRQKKKCTAECCENK